MVFIAYEIRKKSFSNTEQTLYKKKSHLILIKIDKMIIKLQILTLLGCAYGCGNKPSHQPEDLPVLDEG